jgi:ribosomal protein S18 acetylase RimI-like enzyme
MAGPSLDARAWRSIEDTVALRALVSRRLAADWPSVRMHPGDVEWWSVQAWGDDRPPVSERVRMWSEEGTGRLAAFAWFTPPSDLDLVLDAGLMAGPLAGLDAIHQEAVAWAHGRRVALAPGQGAPMRLWAVEGGAQAGLLEARGLHAGVDGEAFVHLTGPLEAVVTAPLEVPRGLDVRPIADADVPARVVCGRAAFVTSTMTLERYRRTFLAGSYRPELDRVVVDGAGSVLAFALGWYDPSTRVVELEPVGVRPDHHRRGLGSLVCRSVLRTAGELGATRAMVAAERRNEAAVGLYRSLGLAVTSTILPYALPVAAVHPDPGLS